MREEGKINLPPGMKPKKKMSWFQIGAWLAAISAVLGWFAKSRGLLVAVIVPALALGLSACAMTMPDVAMPNPTLFGKSSAEGCLAAAARILDANAAAAYCISARKLEADRATAAAKAAGAAEAAKNPCDGWLVPLRCQNFGNGGYGGYSSGGYVTVGSVNTMAGAGARPYTPPTPNR